MADSNISGGWKQETYPWASNAPRSADDVGGRPPRNNFWVIPALIVALIVVFILLLAFAPSDDPPEDGAAVHDSAMPTAPLLVK